MSWWDDNYTRSDFRSWLTNEGSFFMVNDRLFKEVGEFDEKFVPAYGEDVDMQYRLELAVRSILVCGVLALFTLVKPPLRIAMVPKRRRPRLR